MKSLKTIILSAIILLISFSGTVTAQTAKTAEIKITTSAICKSCKKTIEKALSTETGVTKSNLDVATKIATVTYDPTVTSPEKIRLAISNAGYDADAVKANPKAYKKLSDCCKKENAGKGME